MEKKYRNLIIIGVIGIILALISVTYAYWLITKTQSNSNIITSKCLDVSISGETNDINLVDAYPITDEEGEATIPYTFTITNNCNSAVDYQVALESIGNASESLQPSSIKVKFDNKNARTLDKYSNVSTTVDEAYSSHRLTTGTLSATGEEGSSKTFSLRLWIDSTSTIEENGKTFESKISVSIGQGIEHVVEPYAYLTYTGSNVTGPSIGGDASDLEKSAPSDKKYYLKFKLDDDNKVTNSYACARFGGEEYCLEGGSGDTYGWNTDASHSTGRVQKLYEIEQLNIPGVSCNFDSGRSYCRGDSVYLFAYSFGNVNAYEGGGKCSVIGDGSSRCVSL